MKRDEGKWLLPQPVVHIHNVTVHDGGYIRLSLEPVKKRENERPVPGFEGFAANEYPVLDFSDKWATGDVLARPKAKKRRK